MLPIRNISYLYCISWEKYINSHKIGQGWSTPLNNHMKILYTALISLKKNIICNLLVRKMLQPETMYIMKLKQ